MVAAKYRDVPLLQPRNDRGMQAGRPAALGSTSEPGTLRVPPRPHARADKQCVARPDLHAGLLLPRLEILDIDRSARLEVGNALQPGNVNEDAAREDAVLDVV